jgi:uncharacterized OsmC-like protein
MSQLIRAALGGCTSNTLVTMAGHKESIRQSLVLCGYSEESEMRIFEVELKRTSYAVIRVEAENKEQAEKLAWEELASDGSYGEGYANWDIESIEEDNHESNRSAVSN